MAAVDTERHMTSKEWLTLVTVAMVQLIVVLAETVVAIALPQAQIELRLSNAARSWAITGYALAFGSLLLLGGLLVSRWGMKLALLIGLIGFGASSALGGMVDESGQFLAARILQGIFAALMAPAALAILNTSFSEGRVRAVAFAVFGTCAGVGAALGLLLGGLLTEMFSWRWTLLMNVPVVITVVMMAAFVLPNAPPAKTGRIDFPGLALVIPGLASIVYGLTIAEHGWNTKEVAIFLVLGLVLLVAFVVVERSSQAPLLPLDIVFHRVRGTAMLIQALAGVLMIGAMLFLAFHLQLVLKLSPFIAGLATVPQTVTILITVAISVRFLEKLGPKIFLVTGLLMTGLAFAYLGFVSMDGTYLREVFPALIVSGLGLGFIFMPLQNVALYGVRPEDAGPAGATLNAASQVGGSVGLAVFTSIAGAAASGGSEAIDLVKSHSAVFTTAALLVFAMSILAGLVLPRGFRPSAAATH